MNKTKANCSIENENHLETADIIIFGLKVLLHQKRDVEDAIEGSTKQKAAKLQKLLKLFDDYFEDAMQYHARTACALKKKTIKILGKKK